MIDVKTEIADTEVEAILLADGRWYWARNLQEAATRRGSVALFVGRLTIEDDETAFQVPMEDVKGLRYALKQEQEQK